MPLQVTCYALPASVDLAFTTGDAIVFCSERNAQLFPLGGDGVTQELHELPDDPLQIAKCGNHHGFLFSEFVMLITDGNTFIVPLEVSAVDFAFRVDVEPEPLATIVLTAVDGSLWAVVVRLNCTVGM